MSRLQIESLESRPLLAANLDYDTGTWSITGTGAADTIYVARDEYAPQWLIVEVNGRIEGDAYLSDVSRIQVSGGGGADWFEIGESTGAIPLPVQHRRGDGDDTLIAGSGPAMLVGDHGNDQLIGGAKNDLLMGGPGNDYLRGGLGVDQLDGGTGSNQLVSDASDQSIS
jgi:Ca2+-binding RTX toxin-like protein